MWKNYAGCVERKLVFRNAVEYLVSLIGRLPCIQICSGFRIEVFRWHYGLILQDRWNIRGKRPREKAKFLCFDCDDFGVGFGDGDGAWEDMIGGLPHMYGRKGVRTVFLGSLRETGSWGASDGGVFRGLAGGFS